RFSGNSGGTGIRATLRINSGEPEEIESTKPMADRKIDVQPGKKGIIQVANQGKNILFARLILTGIPAKGDTTSSANSLKISLTFKSMNGEIIKPQVLGQGTNFLAEVSITNPGLRGSYQQLALSQVFPSGWEIINARNSELAQSTTDASSFDYQDVRDDRVYTYFEIAPNQSKTFRILLMATYLGRFYLPSTSCEAMYDNSISARVPGGWVEVLPALK
ncbi:MAG: hypothetical protein WCI71_17185, partial [Bacteroidota bacterium]